MDFGSESPPSRTIEKKSSDEKPKKHYNFGVCLAQIQNIHKYTMFSRSTLFRSAEDKRPGIAGSLKTLKKPQKEIFKLIGQ